MAPDVSFVEATVEHAEHLAPRLREADLAECIALGYSTGLAALLESLRQSCSAFSMIIDGTVVALFGVIRLNDTAAQVWLLTGEEVFRYRKAFVSHSRAAISALLVDFELLLQAVDARYEAALRWARWVGFAVGKPQPLGPAGLPFCLISLRRATWAQPTY